MHEMFFLDVNLEIDVRTEALPAVETQEGSLPSVGDQVMFQTDGNLEWSVTLRTDLVLVGSCFFSIHQMTQTMEHDLVSPAKLPRALATTNLTIGRSLVPVHPPHQTLPDVELVVQLPLLQLVLPPLLV